MVRVSMVLMAFAIGCRGEKKAPPPPPPPVVTVIGPVEAMVPFYFEYNGTVAAKEIVEIRARVEGYLTEVLFKNAEGEEVVAGAPLFVIDPKEYESAVARARGDIARAKADIGNATAQIALAEADLKRRRDAGRSEAPFELDKAVAALAASEAQLQVAKANKTSAEAAERTAQIKLDYTRMSAPIDGVISRSNRSQSNVVGQNEATLLTTIVSVEPMEVTFDVPEQDFQAFQGLLKSKDANLRVEIAIGSETGYPHAGKLYFKENRVETGSGTIRIRGGSIPNPKQPPNNTRKLSDGMNCRVRVPDGEPKKLLTIPEDALMTGQEGRFVYVIGPENVILKRTVVVGPNIWRMDATTKGSGWTLTNPKPKPESKVPATATVRSVVAIESGLQPGDRIVAVGLLKARPGQAVAPEDWDFKAPVAKEAK